MCIYYCSLQPFCGPAPRGVSHSYTLTENVHPGKGSSKLQCKDQPTLTTKTPHEHAISVLECLRHVFMRQHRYSFFFLSARSHTFTCNLFVQPPHPTSNAPTLFASCDEEKSRLISKGTLFVDFQLGHEPKGAFSQSQNSWTACQGSQVQHDDRHRSTYQQGAAAPPSAS